MEDKKIKHLEMIENVIERMAGNSFQLKGWTIALIGLVTVFFSNANFQSFLGIIVFLLLAFWYMDSYYLQLEKKYRILYSNVCEKSEDQIDFNMDLQNIEINESDKKKTSKRKCLFSDSELGFYGPVVLAVLVLRYLL